MAPWKRGANFFVHAARLSRCDLLAAQRYWHGRTAAGRKLRLETVFGRTSVSTLSILSGSKPPPTFKHRKWGDNMGAIIGWIIFGVIAGAIAKLLMPGKDPGGFVVTILLGIAGAVVGGFIGRALWGSNGVNDWSFGSFALAIGGAIILLAIYRMIAGRRRTTAEVVTRDRDRWAA
jgi:uncharacterized membrane protein YeaQ/YmgE (transglycosylase-associated protein family)